MQKMRRAFVPCAFFSFFCGVIAALKALVAWALK